ncbi:MAG TPA: hypothetical protein VK217_02520, partial [Acidimicrobiales bacterium]|nr:hypothetical protein [Acidimicrobiales bacterium]
MREESVPGLPITAFSWRRRSSGSCFVCAFHAASSSGTSRPIEAANRRTLSENAGVPTIESIWTPLAQITRLGVAAFPISLGVAMLKYRLYEIDRIISRTLSYSIVTGLVVGVYVGIITLVTRVLGFSSPVAVAASTLAAVALFNPLRHRVQHVVDRRFNRARYDAEATI